MLTLNNIVQSIQVFATAHKALKGSFLFDLPLIKGPDTAPVYPMLYAILIDSEISENQDLYTIEFTIFDQPGDGNNRREVQECLSDAKLTANDFVSYWATNRNEDILVDLPVSMTPIVEGGEDGVYGWQFNLKFRLAQGVDACSIPADNIPANYSGMVTIYNEFGEVVARLNAGQSLTIQQLQQIIDTVLCNTEIIQDTVTSNTNILIDPL